MVINTTVKLEENKPKFDFQLRNSTGNADTIFSNPKQVPNYLRVSIGSCHDFCKYGNRHEPELEAQSNAKYRRKKVSGAKKSSVPLSSRKQPGELKPKPLVRNLPSSQKQPILKSKNDVQKCQNEASKGMRMLNASKNTSSLPAKIPTAKKSSMKMISQWKIKKSAHENSETGERSSCGDIAEKIIHVVETTTNGYDHNVDHADQDGNCCNETYPIPEQDQTTDSAAIVETNRSGDDQNVDLADEDGNCCNETSSSPNQTENTDSAAKSWEMAVRVGRAVMKENGSSPRKQKIKREKALGIENGSGSMSISLRSVVNDGHSIHDEKDESIRVALRHQAMGGENSCPDSINTVLEATASRLTRMSKSKVKALVDSFETLVNIQDSKVRVYSRAA